MKSAKNSGTAVLDPIDRMMARTKQIAEGKDPKVKPGQTERFTEACGPGDAIRQGDLYLVIRDMKAAIPSDYQKVEIKPAEAERLKQLVPGNTQGAKHCLDSLKGVTMYRPNRWDDETLQGPILVLAEQREVLHPVHGSVILLAGSKVQCLYQREHAKELARQERRNRD